MAVGHKTGGRKKGVPNKLTGQVREMILKALDDVGGVEYLKAQAFDNPVAFMTLIGKVLPLQVSGPDDGPIQVARIELVPMESGDDTT